MSLQEKIITIIMLIVCAVFFFNIGFASEFDYENNTNYYNSEPFNIEFENLRIVNSFGVDENNTKITISPDNKNISLNLIELENPGAYVEFAVDVINKGRTNAKIDNLCISGFENSQALKFNILNQEDIYSKIIKPKEKCSVFFIIKWDENINIISDECINFNIQIPTCFVK